MSKVDESSCGKIVLNSASYYPLNLNSSEEDISTQGISIQRDHINEKEAAFQTIAVQSNSENDPNIYYKYAMLIGLCKEWLVVLLF